jgi:hypothetical protein
MDYAQRAGVPIVAFNDSGGARIQEGVLSLAGYGQVFFRNVLLSGVVPQIAVICGPCAGGAAYSPALMDFLIMTKDTASMFICGPEVIKAATGQVTTMEEIGSAAANATISGNVQLLVTGNASVKLDASNSHSFTGPMTVNHGALESIKHSLLPNPLGKIGTGADFRVAMVMALASDPGLGHRREIRSRPQFPPERETYGASTNRRTVSPRCGVQIGFTPAGSGSHRMKIRWGACSK